MRMGIAQELDRLGCRLSCQFSRQPASLVLFQDTGKGSHSIQNKRLETTEGSVHVFPSYGTGGFRVPYSLRHLVASVAGML